MKLAMRIGEIVMGVVTVIAIGRIYHADILVIGKIYMTLLYAAVAGLFVLFTETMISEIS